MVYLSLYYGVTHSVRFYCISSCIAQIAVYRLGNSVTFMQRESVLRNNTTCLTASSLSHSSVSCFV